LQAQIDKIESIVRRRRPDVADLVIALRAGFIDQATADDLQDPLIDELMEFGVDQDGEENRYGQEVDDLIGVVQERVEGMAPSH
jgi:hypothetical protein